MENIVALMQNVDGSVSMSVNRKRLLMLKDARVLDENDKDISDNSDLCAALIYEWASEYVKTYEENLEN